MATPSSAYRAAKEADDGGPAFPHMVRHHGPDLIEPLTDGGMSLRDWFASQALAGHLASLNPGSWGRDQALAQDAADGAYLVADAMLKARNGGAA